MASRLTQEPFEVVILPSDSKARITQAPREVAILPTDSKARITQAPREVAIAPTDSVARITQIVRESLVAPTDSVARITQIVREVLIQNVAATPGDDYPWPLCGRAWALATLISPSLIFGEWAHEHPRRHMPHIFAVT